MNIRKALEKAFSSVPESPVLPGGCWQSDGLVEHLAPIIEKALRAAYRNGWTNGHDNGDGNPIDGINAGIAAIMEVKP